jgi:ribonuclease D
LRDATLFDIARRLPRTDEQLALTRDMDEHGLRKWANDVLGIVAAGQDQPAQALWSQPAPLTPEQTRLYKQMTTALDAAAGQHHISPTALATRKEIQRLLLGDTDLPLLRGWRLAMVGQSLRDMVAAATANRP